MNVEATRERLGGSRPALHDPRRFSHADGFPRRRLRVGTALSRRSRATSSSPRIRNAARPGRSTSSTCSRTTAGRWRRGRGSTTCSRISRRSARSACARCRSRGSSRRTCRLRARRGAQQRNTFTSRAIRSIAPSRSTTTRAASCATTISRTAPGTTFFECFVRGEVDFGDYFDHLVSWWPRRAEPNVLFLTYEQMLAAPAAAVRAIAEFLGRPRARARARRRGASTASCARAASSKCAATKSAGRARARPTCRRSFAKGVVGDWRNHFSAEQARRLAEKFRARTAGTGIEELWPGLVANALE